MPRASDLAENITQLIESNVWREGQRLPAERALCEQFGSARNTVRKALEQVEREARIARRDGHGFVVRDGREPDLGTMVLPAVLAHAALPPSDFMADISRASPSDIMELRLIVEPMAAGLAAVRASVPDIDRIAHAAEAIEAAVTFAEREEADAHFHSDLFAATRNPLLLSLCHAINGVREHAQWFERKHQILTPERRSFYDRQHQEIVLAVRRRDSSEASNAMRTHLETLRADLLGQSVLR